MSPIWLIFEHEVLYRIGKVNIVNRNISLENFYKVDDFYYHYFSLSFGFSRVDFKIGMDISKK